MAKRFSLFLDGERVKFLLDQNLSPKTTELFRELGFDALDVRELGMSGMPDDEIYRLAKEEGRILVTFDLDFARRFMAHKDLPGLVILRVHPQTLELKLRHGRKDRLEKK